MEEERTRRRRVGSRPLVLLPSASAFAAAAAGAGAAPRRPTALTRASASDAAGSSNGSGSVGGSGNGRGGGKRLRGNRAREPGLFEIKDVSPPPRSLGVYALPPNTHTQDVIELRVDPSSTTEDWQATGATAASAASAAVVASTASSSSSDDDAPADDEAAVRRYIVTALVLQFKLVAGRYRRDHSRLEVQPVGRYLTNLALESAFRAKPYQKKKDDDGK